MEEGAAASPQLPPTLVSVFRRLRPTGASGGPDSAGRVMDDRAYGVSGVMNATIWQLVQRFMNQVHVA